MRENPFELALCARLEREREAVVARQLGAGVRQPGGRVMDVVVVEPGPAFQERARLTPREIPPLAIESAVGRGRARDPRDAIDASPEVARRVAERAVEVGFFELDGPDAVRQVARYPEGWFGRLVGVENKPDLGSPGALAEQLRQDVALGAFDAVVVATESHVTGAHRNRIPDPVGIWRVDYEGDAGRSPSSDAGAGGDPPADAVASGASVDGFGGSVSVEVVREPSPLAGDGPGVEIREEHPGRTDVAVVDADEKRRARRRIAERAYGKGWRPALPGCAEAREGVVEGGGALPYCDWKGRLVDPGNCGPDCPGYDPADPPEVDPERERDARTPWIADPEGGASRQAGLDRFSE